MKLSRKELWSIIRPGDCILVHYKKPDAVQMGIKVMSGGSVEHVLCSLGGTDVVEADIVGVVRSDIFNYMRGQCDLTIKRVKPKLRVDERSAVKYYWLQCVGEHYDIGMIVGMLFLFLIRKFLHHISERLALWSMHRLKNIFANKNYTTCAELWINGIRVPRPGVLSKYPAPNVAPETILRDSSLEEVWFLRSPVLEG